jgi:hypothetical protein
MMSDDSNTQQTPDFVSNFDPSVLTGGTPQSSGLFDVAPPAAPAGGSSPVIPAQTTGAPPAPPDIQTAPQGPATQPQSTDAPPPPPQGQQSVWKNLVMGAMWGLAGSAGSTHFGGGLARGAAGVLNQQQQQFENAQREKQLQFESVRAADAHIAALDEHQRANQLSDEAKLDYKQKSAQYQTFLQDNFGIEPDLSFNDNATEANAGLKTLSDKNGGTIPSVATIQHPEPDGTHGTVSVYSPSQQQMRQNSNGFRNLVNTQRAAQGLPEIDDATWNSLGFKGQRDLAQKAIEFMKPTPSYSLDKNKPDYLPVVLAQRQQQLDQYEQHKDVNGKPDYDPNVAKQLQNGITYLQGAWQTTNNMENDAQVNNINATSPAKANAAAANVIAENSGAAGQAKINQKAGEAGAEAKARQQFDNKPVYAIATDAQGNQRTVMTTSAQAAQNNMTGIRPVKEGDIRADQHDIKVLNDIQVKSDNVRAAASAMDDKSWSDAAAVAKMLADNPNTTLNSLLKSKAFEKATPQAQAYAIAVNSLRESSMGLQKVLTGSARSNEVQLQALLTTLPGLEPNSGIVTQKLGAFEQNLGMLAQGLPENTGVPLQVRKAGQAPPTTAQPTQPPAQSVGHKTGDVIVQNGRSFIVTSVDPNGKVTGANPQ